MSYIQVQWNLSRTGKKLGYVHLARSVWDPAKKRSVQRRVYIGRLDERTGEVVISKGFPGRSGQRVRLEELKQRVQNQENLEVWLRMPMQAMKESGATDRPACVEVVGDAHVLRTIARETGLEDALAESFGGKDAAALLGLAFHQVVEGRPLYLAEDWLAERELPADMRSGRTSVRSVYDLIRRVGGDYAGRESFFRNWLRRHSGGQGVVVDTTSISSYASVLDLVEYGYNRNDERLPQINLCLAVDRSSRLPLWCRAIPGSIPDVSTLKTSVAMLQDLGLEQALASLDRGFYSGTNVRDMLNEGLDFVIGIPFSLKAARGMVRKHRTALDSPKRSFPYDGRIMRHVRDRWEIRGGASGNVQVVEAHLFLDPTRRAEQIQRLEKTVFELESKAARERFERRGDAVDWLAENARMFARCFGVEALPGGTFAIRRKPRAVALAAARMGYTLVATSEPGLCPEEVLRDYRTRDQVEKLFDSLKNDHGQNRLRTGDNDSAEGRLFLAFIALALRAAIEHRMRTAGLLNRLTVTKFFAQMRRIKSVTMQSGKRFLLETTKRQRELLQALHIPPPS